jgi:hypothetical protein
MQQQRAAHSPHSPPHLVPRAPPAAGAADLLAAITTSIATARGARSSSSTTNQGRLERRVRGHVEELLRRSAVRWWAAARGKELAPPRLHPAILRAISEWCVWRSVMPPRRAFWKRGSGMTTRPVGSAAGLVSVCCKTH